MNKKRKLNLHILFPALVLLTILVCMPMFINAVSAKDPAPSLPDTEQTNSDQTLQKPEELPATPSEDKHQNEIPDEQPGEQTDSSVPKEEQPPEEPKTTDITLFIGDSRTVGLMEYSGIENAEYFCSVGMNVYKIFDTTADMPGRGSVYLESLLNEVKFKRIHLMLGINELGYDHYTTVDVYQDTVNKIRELQPDAVLYLGANLHVTAEKSNSDNLYNNQNINRFNQAVAAMADGKSIFYADVNEVFDEGGALAASITWDGVHVYASCYETWGQWLCEFMDNAEGN